MIFSGTFNTYDNNQTYSITIGNTGVTKTIVDPTDENYDASEMNIMFASDPIVISCDRQDLFKRIIISQAQINLISNEDLTNYFFVDTNRTMPVTITMNSEHVFSGYVDPLQFSQGYAHNYEDITITATDPLGALEDIKINQCNHIDASTYTDAWTMIGWILASVGIEYIDIGTNINPYINNTVFNTLRSTKVRAQVFFGDNPDDYQSAYSVLENICKYYNLYIAMNGANRVIITSTINNVPTQNTISNFKNAASDDSTSLSVDDVYSQVAITCNIEPIPDVSINFDNRDNIYSDYDSYQKYMIEYVTEVNDDWNGKSWDEFYQNLFGNNYNYENSWTRDHYCLVFRNDMWDFGQNSYITARGGNDTTPMDSDKGQYKDIYQLNVLTWLVGAPFRAALVAYGKGDKIPRGEITDNSVKSNLTLDKYLVISTNGDFRNDTTKLDYYENLLQPLNTSPICTYKGLSSSILSPQDAAITNYIVISGSILLNPAQRLTGPNWSSWTDTLNNDWRTCVDNFRWVEQTVPGMPPTTKRVRNCFGNTIDYNDGKAYYNQFWFGGSLYAAGTNGVYGFLDNSANQMLKYEYSSTYGSRTDTISKMPVLSCRLKVGDKYCVERLDRGTEGQNTFEWLTEAQATALGLPTTFTIGIDPKIGDKILGVTYPIANTVTYNLNLDKTGMAIPIKMSDNLSGTIEFSILGPYNATWKEITKYTSGWLFWKHTNYEENLYSILSNCQSIMIKDFSIEMTSNNGNKALGINSDNDLVYASISNQLYNEKYEDSIDICTPLTLAECEQYQVKSQTSNSYVYNSDDTPFRGFQSGNDNVKPEVCLVDYLYKEYGAASRKLETQVKASTIPHGMYGNRMNEDMLVSYFSGLTIGDSRLMSYSSSLKMKTIDTVFRQHKTISNVQI